MARGLCGLLTVHPRRRGERAAVSSLDSVSCGSSPQARGTAGHRRHQIGGHRFIPAGAGNGFTTPETKLYGAVHPRRRGERGYSMDGGSSTDGSSPQARGTVRRLSNRATNWRFIPAGAGNGTRLGGFLTQAAVHPRRRGERLQSSNRSGYNSGSSPQARGTERARRAQMIEQRFIPAGAGNGLSAQ